MTRLQRTAVLTRLVERLREQGSWCGETHLQKSAYFLQELLRVPIGCSFVLYMYGPFSFDLSGELSSMCADGLLKLEVQPVPYGPKIATTAEAKAFQERFPKTLQRYHPQIEFVANNLGCKRVSELERLATALYVTREHPDAPLDKRTERVRQLKPHVPTELARKAVEDVDAIIKTAPVTSEN